MEEMVRGLRNQREAELKIVASLEPLANKADSSIIRFVLGSLVLDSKRHALLMEALVDLVKGEVVSEGAKGEVAAKIREHMGIERDAFEEALKLVERAPDEQIKFALQNMIEDEKRHHHVLQLMMNALSSSTTALEKWKEMVAGC